MKEVLLGKSLPELTQWVQEQGQPSYRGKQLYQWLYEKGASSIDEITVFPKKWRESQTETTIGRSEIYHCSVAKDGTRKYLLKLADSMIIEAVGIPTCLLNAFSIDLFSSAASRSLFTSSSSFFPNRMLTFPVDPALAVLPV